jgi:predicted DNA-binding transcriptional regulator AlpA
MAPEETPALREAYCWTKADAARFLGITIATLNKWMVQGKAPDYRKMGGYIVRFRPCDVVRFAESQPAARPDGKM